VSKLKKTRVVQSGERVIMKLKVFRPKYIDRKLLVLNVREQLFIMSIAKKGKALSV
jgi:hypothetical protein